MADLPEVTLKSRPRKKIRWWPAFLILLLAVVAIYWVRTSYGRHRQDQNIAIANIVIIAFALLIVWCVLLSRFNWKLRWGLVGSALGLIGVAAALFGLLEIGLEIAHYEVQVRNHVDPIKNNLWSYVIGALLLFVGFILFAGSNSLAEQLTDDYDDDDDDNGGENIDV